MIAAFFVAWNILAAEVLDSDMTAQEKKQTGVYKLDDRQKAALQQWIDAHYQKKSEPAVSAPSATSAPTVSGVTPTLSENLLNGRYIRLSDTTLWNIRPADVPIVQAWITPVEIIVTQSSDPFFPSKLINKLTGSFVLARKVDRLPPAGSPALSPTSAPESSGQTIAPPKTSGQTIPMQAPPPPKK